MKILIHLLIIAALLGGLSARSEAATDLTIDYSIRVSNYEKNYPVKLNEEESSFIKTNCTNIKNNIAKIKTRIDQTTLEREKVYGEIEQKLSAVQSRMTRQSLDTSVIDLMLASYRVEVSNYKDAAENYSLTLGDIITLDCVSNPNQFKSSVLAARELREDTIDYIAKLKNVYTNQIISGFDLLSKQLYGR